jgi:Icc-related predicted phosphoesterase
VKIQLLSDLHFEFHNDKGKGLVASLSKDCDVLCVAGDLATSTLLEDSLRMLCDAYPRIVFVPGNHEFYGSDLSTVYKLLDKLGNELSNLYWLENRDVEISGQRFLGATLWFERQIDSLKYKDSLSDFAHIKSFEDIVFHKFAISKSFLGTQAKPGDIVITHHMPSLKCIDKQYLELKTNIYFASNLEELIKKKAPAYWFSGHSHSSHNLMIGQTNLISNPLGYPNAINPEFNNGLIITIGK